MNTSLHAEWKPEVARAAAPASASHGHMTLLPHDALLIVDVQNDFLPGGALAVAHGDEVIPVLNGYLRHFVRLDLPVFVTRDWHPSSHRSFHGQSGPWPAHCVMNTPGAEMAEGLLLPVEARMIAKGSDPAVEGYSGFEGTDLEAQLRERGVRRLFVGGLATDYCVLRTVQDARARGFEVFLLGDAIRAVEIANGDGTRAELEMQKLGAVKIGLAALAEPDPAGSALLTDLYQLTMLQGYHASRMQAETAVFEFFVRRLPPGWRFLVAAGLEQVLDFLEDFRFSDADIEWLAARQQFGPRFLQWLRDLRFTGEVHAMPEGTIFFPDEPILRVTAPIAEAQVVETRLVNLLHFQTLIASKAVRSVLAAPGKTLVDFGLRRAHGAEAGLLAARACAIAGFHATSDVLAAQRFGIPLSGTMAHSFVEASDFEVDAFMRFARANPKDVVLLLDTYDTEAAAARVVNLARRLELEDIRIRGVRIDSGDLAAHARKVRLILDAGGLKDVTIFASGNLDEHELRQLTLRDAPIDGYGLGTRVDTAADAAYLDCAYKLQEFAGLPRAKLSEGKETWPGAKQVYRHFDTEGQMESDTIALAMETNRGEPLLRCVMRHGRRLSAGPSLAEIQHRLKEERESLPAEFRRLEAGEEYPVVKSGPLQALARQMHAGYPAPEPAPTPASAHPHLGFLSRIYADSVPPEMEERSREALPPSTA